LSALTQFVVTPERGDHLLADLIAVAAALNNLQIGAAALFAEIHGTTQMWCAQTHA
jgi:hypothetical protein